jgi:hypothetical protein
MDRYIDVGRPNWRVLAITDAIIQIALIVLLIFG